MDGFTPSDLMQASLDQPEPMAVDLPSTAGLINMYDPDGNLVSIPNSMLEAAKLQGFQVAPPEKVDQYFKEQKYGTLSQQLMTGIEGLGRGFSLNMSTPLQVAAGEKIEDIEARREINPMTHMAGEVLGLTGSMLAMPEIGAASLLGKAGQKAAVAAGLGTTVEVVGEGGRIAQQFVAPASGLGKVGSAAIRGATEAGLYQSTDEVAKMLSGQSDPSDFAETGLMNIGLAAALGGGLSGGATAVPEIWKATAGPKVQEALTMLKDKVDNLKVPVPEGLAKAQKELGIELPAPMRAATKPELAETYRAVKESPGKAGIELRQMEADARKDITKKVLQAAGIKEAELVRGSQISDAIAGEEQKQLIIKKIEDMLEPQSKRWEKLEKKLEKTPLTQAQDIFADRLAIQAEKEGWNLIENRASKVYNDLMKRVGSGFFNSAKDIRKYITKVLNPEAQVAIKAGDMTLARDIGLMRSELEDVMVSAFDQAAQGKGVKFAKEYAEAKADYAAVRGQIRELTTRLKPDKRMESGLEGLKLAIREMKPEDVVNRLTRGTDSGLLEALKANFPEVAEKIRKYGIRDLFSKAVEKAGVDELFDPKQLTRSLDNTSPEYRKFLFPKGEPQVQAVRTLLQYFPKHATSATAHNLDQMLGPMGAGIGFIHALMTGTNPFTGALTGYLAKLLMRDVPDHVRLGLLKFLGSDKAIDATAFKAMVNYIGQVRKSENVLNKATKAIFTAEKVSLPSQLIPSEKDRDKLKKQLKELKVNPEKLLNNVDEASHYMPEVGGHVAMVTQNALNYLDQISPKQDKQSPLDPMPVISKMSNVKFDQALNIALSPATILPKIEDGTVTPEDVGHLDAMYPRLKNRMMMKLTNEMVAALAKEQTIPQKTKIGLSIFLGQPLTTAMKGDAIIAAQPMSSEPMAPQGGLEQLGKIGQNYQTPAQRNELRHQKV